MCGIVGKVYRDRDRCVDPKLITRMGQCIAHRGPDDNGSLVQTPIGFGFQRLSIIDVGGGHQPILNETGSMAIVFNGEIYNYRELRDQLLSRGHVFKTSSDTETILHGYEEWGAEITVKLRGMFAFAIYDFSEQTLFIARDRVGKKPLYYSHIRASASNEALLFASEMKSLLADQQVEREVDVTALSHYLTYQYVPHPWSIFQSVKKLPPAHWLLYRQGKVEIQRYWSLSYEPKAQISMEEAVERTLAELDEAVKIRLMSEVPLGCFLSGGIDSSAVVAMMRRHVAGPLRTFSIGFEEETYNELPYARRVARQFDTDHEEFTVRPDAVECLGRLAWHFDEPFADMSAIPTYYLAKMTRQHVTVALNGDGGDESFAGYTRYQGMAALERYASTPRWIRAALQKLGSAMSQSDSAPDAALRAAHMNEMSLASADRRYGELMLIFRRYQKLRLFSADARAGADLDSEQLTVSAMEESLASEPVDRCMHADISCYLPGALLPKVDRMTMANSLEGRSPFLDTQLMEFAASLPASIKFKNGEPKHLLKAALAPIFDHDFLHRPKMGFAVPIGSWFQGQLKALTYELLLGRQAAERPWFNQRYVRQLVEEHMSGRRNHEHRLWSLLAFEAWARTFLDRADPLAGPVDFG